MSKWPIIVLLKTNFPWVLAEIVGARLALDLYLEFYKKITAKANPNDSGIFLRGFSPFTAEQMAFIFYAEDTDSARQPARLHDRISLPGRNGYAIGRASDMHAMASKRLGVSPTFSPHASGVQRGDAIFCD
ncbi:hypothetical protein MRX96_008381 [Rhipicephalus microplus]